MEANRRRLGPRPPCRGGYTYFTASGSAKKELLTKRQATCGGATESGKSGGRKAAQAQLPLAERYRSQLPELAKEEERLRNLREHALKWQGLEDSGRNRRSRWLCWKKQRAEAQARLETADRQLADGNVYIENAKFKFPCCRACGAGTAIDGSRTLQRLWPYTWRKGNLARSVGLCIIPTRHSRASGCKRPRTLFKAGAQSSGYAGKRAKTAPAASGTARTGEGRIFPSPTKRSLPCAASSC